jgi:hypothetical protein
VWQGIRLLYILRLYLLKLEFTKKEDSCRSLFFLKR